MNENELLNLIRSSKDPAAALLFALDTALALLAEQAIGVTGAADVAVTAALVALWSTLT